MKTIAKFRIGVLTALLLLLTSLMWGQTTHRGFYLYTGLGPAFGKIQATSNQGDRLHITGTAYSLDLQIGGFIKENLALHATIGLKSIFGPTINQVKLNDNSSVDEFVMGGGLTYYLKQNFFVSASLGSGNFSFVQDRTTLDTDSGLSFQLNFGKEWWISPRWALGVSGQYSGTSLTSKYADGLKEEWQSNRYSIMLRGTFHGRRS